jgi:hypothetical protein
MLQYTLDLLDSPHHNIRVMVPNTTATEAATAPRPTALTGTAPLEPPLLLLLLLLPLLLLVEVLLEDVVVNAVTIVMFPPVHAGQHLNMNARRSKRRTGNAGVGRRVVDDHTAVHHRVLTTETNVVLQDCTGRDSAVVGRKGSPFTRQVTNCNPDVSTSPDRILRCVRTLERRQVAGVGVVERAVPARLVHEALGAVRDEGVVVPPG